MSNILKGLNEGRNYGRDSWDSNMPGYQGDYGGAKNFGRRNREWDEDDRIDARIRAEYEKKQEYERNGTFWLKLKDSQRHLPSGPFKGKQAANTAAIELLNQQPELKGNLVITAYGPDEGTAIKEDTPGEVKLHNVLWQAVTNESLREENLSEIDPGMITNIMSVFPMISKIIVSNAIGKAKKEASETSSMIATMKKYRDNQPVTPEEKEQMMSQFKDLITYGAMAVGSVMAGMPAGPGIALAGAYKKEIMELIKTKGPEVLISLLQTKGKLDVIKILYHKLLAKNALQYYHPAPQGVAESQLDELSSATLASYKKKAGADASAADKKGDYKRGDKRMSGIIKATKKEFANDKKKKVAEAGMPFRGVGGAFNRGDDERHDLDPTEWYIVKDGKMYKTSVYPNQVQQAIAQGYSRTRDEATARATKQGMAEDLDENLNKWFKEKWVRFGPDGKIRGDCARGDDSEGKPKCLPQSKAQNLGKKGRASAAARKRREDPNPERSGKAINVNTKKKSNEGVAEEQLDELKCWSGYHRVAGTKAGFPGSCAKNKTNESEHSETCPHCGGEMVSEELMNEKKDACYYKVKSRYKVWPSAYASGALVKCRKSGADSWGNGGKKNESIEEGLDEAVGDNYLYHATQPGGIMRILRTGVIKASDRPQAATKSKTQYPTVSTTRSKQYAESEDFVDFLNLTRAGNSVIIVFDRNAVANHYKMFSTSQGTQTVGDEFEEVIVVPKGIMPIQGTMKGFYFNPRRTAEIEEFKDIPWFKELLNSPYYMGQKQGVAEDQLDEKWTKKYKDSINCSNPKGFSQKAHCAGKQKNESAIMKGLK